MWLFEIGAQQVARFRWSLIGQWPQRGCRPSFHERMVDAVSGQTLLGIASAMRSIPEACSSEAVRQGAA